MRGTRPPNQRAAKPPGMRKSSGLPEALSLPPPPSSSLHASVLVLNRLYMAVHVIGVRRAFGLLCRELAEVIHPGEGGSFANYTFETWLEASRERVHSKQPHEDWIRSVNFEIQVPRVIRLLRYDRLPKQGVHLNRRKLEKPGAVRAMICPSSSNVRRLIRIGRPCLTLRPRAAEPCCSHRCRQRAADWTLTPKVAATLAGIAPCSKSSAALRRRERSPAKSRFFTAAGGSAKSGMGDSSLNQLRSMPGNPEVGRGW